MERINVEAYLTLRDVEDKGEKAIEYEYLDDQQTLAQDEKELLAEAQLLAESSEPEDEPQTHKPRFGAIGGVSDDMLAKINNRLKLRPTIKELMVPSCYSNVPWDQSMPWKKGDGM